LQDFDLRELFLEEGAALLDLSAISEVASAILPAADGKERERISIAVWPTQYTGIMALIFKANHILDESSKRGALKYSSKPLLPHDDCWKIILPE